MDVTKALSAPLYLTPTGPIPPSLPTLAQYDSANCPLPMNATLGETKPPIGPFLKHPVSYYQPVTIPAVQKTNFENVAKFSHFVRTAVSYDRWEWR